MNKASNTDWFLQYWALLLFPAFICAAGAQWATALPAGSGGWLIAFFLVRFGSGFFDGERNKWLFTLLTPLLLLGAVALLAPTYPTLALFDGADLNNPALTGQQMLQRALISGLGGLFAAVLSIGLYRLYLRVKGAL